MGNGQLNSDGMRYFRLKPDARLRGIHCYWWVEPNGASPPAIAPDLLIPDGHAELVFRFAGEFDRWELGAPGKRSRLRSSYVIGGRSKSILAHSTGGLRLAGVKLDPRVLCALLGMPLTELLDRTVSCAELGCAALLELEDEIANLRHADGLRRVCDRFFLRTLAAAGEADAATDRLVDAIRITRGAQPILAWARAHDLHPRTVERRFLARMGLKPKQFARIERFKHSYHALTQRRPGARRAHLDAYYDASHFDREFRHFMGTSPPSWLAGEPAFTTVIGDHLLAGEMFSSPLR